MITLMPAYFTMQQPKMAMGFISVILLRAGELTAELVADLRHYHELVANVINRKISFKKPFFLEMVQNMNGVF
jgi:hypothetical protein